MYGGYDTVKPALPQSAVDVEWICVTDDPDIEADGWTVVYEPQPGVHPNRAAKRPKFLPWEYTVADASVWIDASFRVASDRFVVDALSLADPIAQFVHPWRDCIYDEMTASIGLRKYFGEPIEAQVEQYRSSGHPEHWGLWATGVIARRHTDRVRTLGLQWLSQVNAWSFQDQISHPRVLREAGLRPSPLPGTHFANPWLSYEASGQH